MAEWFKAPVLKTGRPARVSWVRIPPLPPYITDTTRFLFNVASLPLALPVNSAPIARVRDAANPRRNRRAGIDLLT